MNYGTFIQWDFILPLQLCLEDYRVPWREKEDIKLDPSVIFPVFQVPSWEEIPCPPQDP